MLSDINIRRATQADIPTIWDIRTRAIVQSCRSHYTPELIAAWVHNPMPTQFASFVENEPFFVASVDDTLLGFAALKRASCEVDAVFVCPTAAGQGLGKRLLNHLEKTARSLGIQYLSLDASLNAVAFYQAAGYAAGPTGVHVAQSGLHIPCVPMHRQLALQS